MSEPTTDNLNELAAALARAQSEIEPPKKDATNPFFNSRYASLHAIREAVREVFCKHGLSVVQKPSVVDGRLTLSTMLLHESGQYLECGELAAEVDLGSPQQLGSAITYFRRYALAAISQAVADEDDDANAASQQPRISAKDTEIIANAKDGIAEATSTDELQALGRAIKEHSQAVRNALGKAWTKRNRELMDKENTNADS